MFFRLGAAALLFAAVCLLLPGTVVAEDPEIEEAIEDLIDTVDMSEATEDIRSGNLPNGGLRFFGVPPEAYAQTDPSKSGAVEKAVTFLLDHAVAFGVKSLSVGFDLTKDRTVDTRQYLRFQQTYEDIPVFGGEAIVQMNEDANVTAALLDVMTATELLDTEQVSLTPTVSSTVAELNAIDTAVANYEQDAIDAGVTLTPEEIDDFREDLAIVQDTELVLYDPTVAGNTGLVCLAWKINVAGQSNPAENVLTLVDASSGDVALTYSLVCKYLDRVIRDQENNEFLYPDGNLAREEGEGETDIEDVDNCYNYFGHFYDFYAGEHGRDSIDDQGMTLEAVVRICPFIWDPNCGIWCPCFGGYWDPKDARMHIGEGSATDDIIGHELTHGVTQAESGLEYQRESGAINESLSDIWGEFIELESGGNPDDRWLIGEDVVWNDIPWDESRNMKYPSAADPPCPDRMGSPYWYTGSNQGVFVHTNSGVNNKLCYLLTDGDTFNGRTVSGMGISLVADLYYECQTNLLTKYSDYNALYYALQQAAVNLGLSQAQRDNIEQGCRAVEIRPTIGVTIKGSDGEPLVRFTDDGDILLSRGEIVAETTANPVYGCLLKDAQYTALAWIDSDSGDFHLKGKLFQDVNTVWTIPDGSLVFRVDGEPKAHINSQAYFDLFLLDWVPAGSLILDGHTVTLGF